MDTTFGLLRMSPISKSHPSPYHFNSKALNFRALMGFDVIVLVLHMRLNPHATNPNQNCKIIKHLKVC